MVGSVGSCFTNLGSVEFLLAIADIEPELRLILGTETILTATALHSGQCIGALYSKSDRNASNSPQVLQRYSYRGIFISNLVEANGIRPTLIYTGNIFLSKIAVGNAKVQQALGISTIPLILPSTGAQLNNK